MEDKCNGKKKNLAASENDNKCWPARPDGVPFPVEIFVKEPTGIVFSIDCFIFI